MAAAWVSALERTPVSELLQVHKAALDRLRSELAPELQAARGGTDDIWLLRYVLSFNSQTEAAADAARRALEWRRSNAELIEAARSSTAPPGLTRDELRAIDCFCISGFHGATAFGDPLFVIRAGTSNVSALMDTVSEDSMTLFMSYISECAWQRCEALTRAKGYFVKQITLQDLAGTSLNRDSRFFRVLGRSSKMNEWLRPQLLGRMIIFNAPSWMSLAFRIAANFMSKKTLSKVWVHGTRTDDSPTARDGLCPYAQQLLGSGDSLPTFLGGTCGGCSINGMPNSALAPRAASELEGYSHTMRAVQGLLPLEASSASASFSNSAAESAGGKQPRLPIASSSSQQAVPSPARGRSCWDRCCRGRRHAPEPPLLSAGGSLV